MTAVAAPTLNSRRPVSTEHGPAALVARDVGARPGGRARLSRPPRRTARRSGPASAGRRRPHRRSIRGHGPGAVAPLRSPRRPGRRAHRLRWALRARVRAEACRVRHRRLRRRQDRHLRRCPRSDKVLPSAMACHTRRPPRQTWGSPLSKPRRWPDGPLRLPPRRLVVDGSPRGAERATNRRADTGVPPRRSCSPRAEPSRQPSRRCSGGRRAAGRQSGERRLAVAAAAPGPGARRPEPRGAHALARPAARRPKPRGAGAFPRSAGTCTRRCAGAGGAGAPAAPAGETGRRRQGQSRHGPCFQVESPLGAAVRPVRGGAPQSKAPGGPSVYFLGATRVTW